MTIIIWCRGIYSSSSGLWWRRWDDIHYNIGLRSVDFGDLRQLVPDTRLRRLLEGTTHGVPPRVGVASVPQEFVLHTQEVLVNCTDVVAYTTVLNVIGTSEKSVTVIVLRRSVFQVRITGRLESVARLKHLAFKSENMAQTR